MIQISTHPHYEKLIPIEICTVALRNLKARGSGSNAYCKNNLWDTTHECGNHIV